ncbi:hypothetical protein GCM10007881_24050 [Mesorhizobium huakuii]|nr:hypothetical protein GCM10007881_24050 [Mesorhizobium huakuii]
MLQYWQVITALHITSSLLAGGRLDIGLIKGTGALTVLTTLLTILQMTEGTADIVRADRAVCDCGVFADCGGEVGAS